MTASFRTTALIAIFAGALASVLLLAGMPSTAGAAVFTVSTNSDTGSPDGCAPGDCTLREAVLEANSVLGADSIEFAPAVTTPTLDGPLPLVTEQLTIDGSSGAVLRGSLTYQSNCGLADFALVSSSPLTLLSLPIFGVCSRAVSSATAAPTIRVGPRKADNTVSINGTSISGAVELFRADAPAVSGEAIASFATGGMSGGTFTYQLDPIPPIGEKFAATVTAGGATSTFSAAAEVPADLQSPQLLRAVAVSNNSARLDFDEPISTALNGQTAVFSLSVGGLSREVTNVGVSGTSIFLTTLTTPWNTGEAGSVVLTGNGRVTDVAGNEVIGQPQAPVLAGPGELTAPTISKARVSPARFCQRETPKCNKRLSTAIQFSLNKPSRVVFTVIRAVGRKFVVRYVRRFERGQIKSRLYGTQNGRRLPATNLIVRIVAEDAARNLSAPVELPLKVVNRNGQL